MNSKFCYIERGNFLRLLWSLSSQYKIIIPDKANKDYYWKEFKGEFELNKYRAITPIRQFLTSSRERIDNYFFEKPSQKPHYCIVGAKNCDLSNALIMQDYVFLEGEADENYKTMRENNLIISSDCSSFKEVCFCLNLKLNPYPEAFFDLNLSELSSGYLVEIGSEKGARIIQENKSLFEEAGDAFQRKRLDNRQKVKEDMTKMLETGGLVPSESLFELMKSGYENTVWQEEALRCVECGACIMNCPTCHCFLLFETKDKDAYLKGRTWDGCQYKNFTRVAGGASALRLREHRLRNRYVKKFEFFPQRINVYACTGCGRCIESCPAKIDLRKVFKYLSETKAKTKP
jgi:ferredoxin